MEYAIRRARTGDVRAIGGLVDDNVDSGRLLAKATVTLYEDVQEFWIAERTADGDVIGCGALHVLWEDLAEIRTIAVHADCQGKGVGHLLVEALLDSARGLGVQRVFVLTFAVGFFAGHGFKPSRTRCTRNCSAPMTRASPSSWTSTASSPTPSAIPACCCTCNHVRPGSQQAQLPVGRAARLGRGRAGQQAGGDRGQER